MTFGEHPQRATLESCDLTLDTWDTDYIADNWEQQYEQLLCDLWIKSDGDCIRNSCDVFQKKTIMEREKIHIIMIYGHKN